MTYRSGLTTNPDNLRHAMEMLWRDKILVIRRFFDSKCSPIPFLAPGAFFRYNT